MNRADVEKVLRECFPDAPTVELEDGTDYDPYIEAAARIAASDTCEGCVWDGQQDNKPSCDECTRLPGLRDHYRKALTEGGET